MVLPIGQTVNQQYYKHVLEKLDEHVQKKTLIVDSHQDNSPAFTNITALEHPPHNPNLVSFLATFFSYLTLH